MYKLNKFVLNPNFVLRGVIVDGERVLRVWNSSVEQYTKVTIDNFNFELIVNEKFYNQLFSSGIKTSEYHQFYANQLILENRFSLNMAMQCQVALMAWEAHCHDSRTNHDNMMENLLLKNNEDWDTPVFSGLACPYDLYRHGIHECEYISVPIQYDDGQFLRIHINNTQNQVVSIDKGQLDESYVKVQHWNGSNAQNDETLETSVRYCTTTYFTGNE